MIVLYKLIDRKPVPCSTPGEWAMWYEQHLKDCQVAIDRFFDGKVRVSTVFLGTCQEFPGVAPFLFETMIFGGKADGFQSRYETWDEAVKGHKDAVRFAVESGV